METPDAHMHVGWAAVFAPPETGRPPRYPDLRDHIAGRLARAPRLRQRLLEAPLRATSPVWVDDDSFEVDRHVRRAGSSRLTEVIDECMSQALPRDRPLWELRVADSLEDGRIGVVGKAHHCLVDGIAAVEFGTLLLDPTPVSLTSEPDRWRPAPRPGLPRVLAGEIADRARDAARLAVAPVRALTSGERLLDFAGRARRGALALADAARPAKPVAPFNEPISPRRHLSLLKRPLDDLVQIKRAFGVKLNDVLLAASAGALRRFQAGRGARPAPLKAMVPANVRASGEQGEFGNRISFMFIDLPCDEPDAARRLRDINGATTQRKERGGSAGAEDVLSSIGLAPAPVRRLLSRLAAAPRTFNLAVSNIPGPREPLFMLGCELVEAYPVVPLPERHALSIGMTTVCDRACFGLYSDRRALPDADQLAVDLDEAIDELLDYAEAPVPVEAPFVLPG